MARVVAIVGRSSAGKTTLRRKLERELHWTSYAIDEHRQLGGGWDSFLLRVYLATYPLLLESIAMPPSYRRALAVHDSRLIVVTCAESVRLARGGLSDDRDYAYEWDEIRTVDCTGPFDIRELVAWCRADA